MYFQYTLNDLQERSSKKEFSYITFFAAMVVHRVVINSGGDVRYMNEFQQIHVDTYLKIFQTQFMSVKISNRLLVKVSWNSLDLNHMNYTYLVHHLVHHSLPLEQKRRLKTREIAYGNETTKHRRPYMGTDQDCW